MEKDNENNELRVFLGGTCAESQWREALTEHLEIDHFNPVVPNWDDEARKEELKQREECDFCLYTITPRMQGVYSIAEVVDDSNKRPDKTIFCVSQFDVDPDNPKGSIAFADHEMNSLHQVGEMVKRNGGKYFSNLEDVSNYLNSFK